MNKALKKELVKAGAKTNELNALINIASKLSLIKVSQTKTSKSFLNIFKPASLTALGLVTGVFLILFSQSVLPSSWLYPVQAVADNVAIDIKPSYRENIMMKRAQQVNQLVVSRASNKQVLSTLRQYSTLAREYKKSLHVNYAAYEFCKKNLISALASAPPALKSPILNSLRNVENI